MNMSVSRMFVNERFSRFIGDAFWCSGEDTDDTCTQVKFSSCTEVEVKTEELL